MIHKGVILLCSCLNNEKPGYPLQVISNHIREYFSKKTHAAEWLTGCSKGGILIQLIVHTFSIYYESVAIF